MSEPFDRPGPAWVTDHNAAMLVDLYELTMVQAYLRGGMDELAVFDLFIRRLPSSRNYLIAAGLDDVLRYLETITFGDDAIEYLRSTGRFGDDMLDWLREFRFTGDVYAMPEGAVAFADEPLVQIVAPLPQAQLIETFVLNQIHLQTMLASKAARVVDAARGRSLLDFGLRRMHGTDAGMKAARALYIAGVGATSNVLAGQVYGIPVAGTMAHSYIQAHDDERSAFEAFASVYPDTTLLVDTYDTIEGVRRVIELAGRLGEAFAVQAIRLDSGDLGELARQARRMLDDAGLSHVNIIASGGLDEYAIDELLAGDAPIDGFGVGTKLGVSADAPTLDSAYKLSAYAGRGRMKLSTDKSNLPDRKQVYRSYDGRGRMVGDTIARHDESLDGTPLLTPVMRHGQRLDAGRETLDHMRDRAATHREALPDPLRSLTPADEPYPVAISDGLRADVDRLRSEIGRPTLAE